MIVLIASAIGGSLTTVLFWALSTSLNGFVAIPLAASVMAILTGSILAWQRSRKTLVAPKIDFWAEEVASILDIRHQDNNNTFTTIPERHKAARR